jgi:hypothetical protein
MSSVALPRPAERVAIVCFLLVFLCGGIIGAMAMSYWSHTGATNRIPAISVKEWKDELNLTDDQTRQLTSILDDFSHYYDNVLGDLNSRVLLILNDDQKQKYRHLIERHKSK